MVQFYSKGFDQLKSAMVTTLVLALLNFAIEFTIEADASNIGIRAILSQSGWPMAYFSKAMSIKHQLLLVYDKEMLAILAAVKK